MMTYRVCAGIRLASDGNGSTILNIDNGKFFGLTDVGTFIFKELLAEKRPDEILDTLQEKYREPKIRLEADLNRFLTDLVTKGVCSVNDD